MIRLLSEINKSKILENHQSNHKNYITVISELGHHRITRLANRVGSCLIIACNGEPKSGRGLGSWLRVTTM